MHFVDQFCILHPIGISFACIKIFIPCKQPQNRMTLTVCAKSGRMFNFPKQSCCWKALRALPCATSRQSFRPSERNVHERARAPSHGHIVVRIPDSVLKLYSRKRSVSKLKAMGADDQETARAAFSSRAHGRSVGERARTVSH